MPIDLIDQAIEETKEKLADEKIDESDVKSSAKVLKAVIQNTASEVNIDLS
jgi:hypothetical protein